MRGTELELKRRPSYTPPSRLASAALSANGPSSTSSTSVVVGPERDPLVDAHQRLIGEVFLLRGQMQDMGSTINRGVSPRLQLRDPLLGRGEARRFNLDPEITLGTQRFPWTMRSYLGPGGPSLDPGIMAGARRNPEVSSLDPEITDWNPEEPGGSYLDPEIIIWNPKAIGEPGGTVLRLPRQGYYRHLFGFRILPLESWPPSSSYAVFYFYRKSLTGLEGAGVGVMTQMPGFAAFHVWRSRILIAPGTPMRLRLQRGFSGVILRVRALSFSPRSLYAAWKMMLPELPLFTSILFTRQFATVSDMTRRRDAG
ncbi:hypothetical protein F2Q68_00010440 [Brassica cretica]|uniref:Uncharacterized protein n=1 Tax=Brassica cretica TaxID=69181 RepID=A0A8S9KYD4_BRACR|nr:hypothetical protein F2Q68_00010440 [Brassica cretica]